MERGKLLYFYLEPFLALCGISSVTTSLRDRPDQKIVQSTSERTKGEGSTSVTTLQTDLLFVALDLA